MHKTHYRPMGVLQRIGFDFGVVVLLALHTRTRTQWLVIAGPLLGYGALLLAAGDLTSRQHASRFDTRILGAWAYEF